MKNISKIIGLFFLTLGVVGCTDNFEEYNTNKYAVYKADPTMLLPAMMEPLMLKVFCIYLHLIFKHFPMYIG